MMGQNKEKQKYLYLDEEETLRLIKDDIAEMDDVRHCGKVKDYLKIRQLQEDDKSVSGIAKILGDKVQKSLRIRRNADIQCAVKGACLTGRVVNS